VNEWYYTTLEGKKNQSIMHILSLLSHVSLVHWRLAMTTIKSYILIMEKSEQNGPWRRELEQQ
jgi:hypothetical protein